MPGWPGPAPGPAVPVAAVVLRRSLCGGWGSEVEGGADAVLDEGAGQAAGDRVRAAAFVRPSGRSQRRVGAGKKGQDLADRAIPASGLREREVRLDLVAVAAAVLLPDQVAGLGEIGDDAVGAALGDAQAGRDVAQARAGVVCDAQQHPGVVIGQRARGARCGGCG